MKITRILFAFLFFLVSHTLVEAGLYLNMKHILPAINHAREAEQRHKIPENLLTAIAHVESKCTPYAINAKGRGYYFSTKEKAVQFVNTLRAQGVKNMNIGYMQLNLPSHIKRFKSIDDMLDIKKNIDFAAALLARLYKQYGSWPRAVEAYKSGCSEATKRYQAHVYHIWAKVKVPRITEGSQILKAKGPQFAPQVTLHRGSLHYTIAHMKKILPAKFSVILKEKNSPHTASFKNLRTVSLKMIAEKAENPKIEAYKMSVFTPMPTISSKRNDFSLKI